MQEKNSIKSKGCSISVRVAPTEDLSIHRTSRSLVPLFWFRDAAEARIPGQETPWFIVGKGPDHSFIGCPGTASREQTLLSDILYIKSLSPQGNPLKEAYSIIPSSQMEKLRPRREMTSSR